jgi:hypothetical protein
MSCKNFSVRLTEEERKRLQRLADDSGRSPASVFRRLLTIAELPEGRRLLGMLASDPLRESPQEVQT